MPDCLLQSRWHCCCIMTEDASNCAVIRPVVKVLSVMPLSMSWFLIHTLILTSCEFQTQIYFISWVCPISRAPLTATIYWQCLLVLSFSLVHFSLSTLHPKSMKHCTFFISRWLYYNFHVSCPLAFVSTEEWVWQDIINYFVSTRISSGLL